MAEQSFTATIAVVKPEPRKWENQYNSCAVQVVFEDGSEGEVMTKLDSYQKHIDALSTLKGKSTDFTGEYNERFNQWKITQYPGKPASGGGSGGGGQKREYVVPYHQTAEGVAYEQERTDRRTAVMQAVALKLGGHEWDEEKPLTVKDTARDIFTWIRATSHQTLPAQQQPAPAPAPTPSSGNGEGAPSDDEMKGLHDLAVERFGSKARALKAYKDFFGAQASANTFDEITADQLVELIETPA